MGGITAPCNYQLNRADFRATAIKSVCEQTCSDWELLLIDDGSTDDTKQVVQGFDDDRIKYIWQENQERSAARNRGIKLSKGQYICFLDSDDYFLDNHLAVLSAFVEQNLHPVGMICTGAYYKDSEDNLIKLKIYDTKVSPVHYAINNSIWTLTACIHRECLQSNLFEEKFKKGCWEDSHLWVRLCAQYPFFQIDQHTGVIVEHEERSVHINSIERITNHMNMIKDLFETYSILLSEHLSNEAKTDFIHRKYQMYIYAARIQNRYLVAYKILKMARKYRSNTSDWRYYSVTYLKLFCSQFLKLKID